MYYLEKAVIENRLIHFSKMKRSWRKSRKEQYKLLNGWEIIKKA